MYSVSVIISAENNKIKKMFGKFRSPHQVCLKHFFFPGGGSIFVTSHVHFTFPGIGVVVLKFWRERTVIDKNMDGKLPF